MVLPRPAAFRAAFNRYVTRRAGAQARSRTWQHIGRRTYASGHGAEKSSDLPWIIGSVVVTVPAASWLLSQTPSGGGGHGHGHDEGHEEHEEKEEDTEEKDQEDDGEEGGEEEDSGKDESTDDKKDDKTGDKKAEKKDDSDDSGSDDEDSKETPPTSDDEGDEGDKPSPGSPGQINKNDKKGPGEQQKGDRQKTETHGEKMAAKDHSGAKHPYLEDDEKSKKGEGVTDTAKIHGTVDSRRPAK